MSTTAPLLIDDDDALERLLLTQPRPRVQAVDRVPGELDPRQRIALADRIHALLLDADHLRHCDTAPQRAHKMQIRAAAGRLTDIENVLRSGIPVLRRGERLVTRIVSDDAIGAYCGTTERTMHDAADAACAALGMITPFH
ncbi:hypothetical protein [Patulibacter minatonensis]|uniref:hypothetical protein n=1 Tax=Patulibacter minatonensis TaxID=298163 RepID=UPI00047D3906|nr:hypothetical protein [Patulibacter minatonensis]